MLEYHPLDKLKMLDIAQHIEYANNFTLLEFGVAIGNTMCAMLDALIYSYKIPVHVFGFDSFEGLPEEDPAAAYNPEWFPGAFNIIDELKNKNIVASKDEGIKMVLKRLEQYPFDIHVIIGWYSNLNDKIIERYNITPAQYIHIDCDMYSSAYQALHWIARNDLIANGCIVRYDDWKDDPNMGENKAHHQICREFNYQAEFIPSKYHHNTMFRFCK